MAIDMTRDKLSPDEQHKFDTAWQRNAFNGYANDLMSLHRTLQDTRDPEYVNILCDRTCETLIKYIFFVAGHTKPRVCKYFWCQFTTHFTSI